MVKQEFRIGKALFKDARGAAQLVNLCSKLRSRILLVVEGDYIDCRSILGLLQIRSFSPANDSWSNAAATTRPMPWRR